jgi:two-component system, OmpR family, response regulator ResD
MADFRTVLVVEDQLAVRQVMVRALAEEGYRILEAGNGQEALEVLATEPDVSAIVTDLLMPDMDGFELAAVVAQRSRIPLLFISAYSQTQQLPTPFLAKPFTPAALRAAVRYLLHPREVPTA